MKKIIYLVLSFLCVGTQDTIASESEVFALRNALAKEEEKNRNKDVEHKRSLDAVAAQRDDLLQARKNQHRVMANFFGIGAGMFAAKAFQDASRYKNVDPKAVMAVGAVAAYAVVTPTAAWYFCTQDDYAKKYKPQAVPQVAQENKSRLPWKRIFGGAAVIGAAGCAGYQCAKRYGCNQNQTVAATLAGPGALWAAAQVKKHRALRKAAREQAERDGRIYGNTDYDPSKTNHC